MDLNAVKDFKVLVVGDAIEDVYRHSIPLGKGTKDPIPSVKFEREEVFRGGVWASAAHLTDLVAQVDIWHGNRLTINTKYIDPYKNKMFSVHCSRDLEQSFVPEDLKAYDLCVVFDYGLGFLDDFKRERLMRQSRFLAVNAQSNSLNFGFNRVNEKWPRANFCVVDELEARLAAHDAAGEIEDVIDRLWPHYPTMIITQGSSGATGFKDGQLYHEPALTDRPIDLIGAGDAVLAVTAPFAKAGFSIKDLVHLGNVAGMVKVGILGHQDHVSRRSLEEHL